MKIALRYEIRVYPSSTGYSVATNMRLYDRPRAAKIVKRLRKSGRKAFLAPMRIAL